MIKVFIFVKLCVKFCENKTFAKISEFNVVIWTQVFSFVCVETLCPSQQYFRHVGTISCLPSLPGGTRTKQSIVCLAEGPFGVS